MLAMQMHGQKSRDEVWLSSNGKPFARCPEHPELPAQANPVFLCGREYARPATVEFGSSARPQVSAWCGTSVRTARSVSGSLCSRKAVSYSPGWPRTDMQPGKELQCGSSGQRHPRW